MLSITRHFGLPLFAAALFASPAFARTHSPAFHRAAYRHLRHRELSAPRHRHEIASRRLYARQHWRRRYHAYAPADLAAPYRSQYAERAFAPTSNGSTWTNWHWHERRDRTARFAENPGGRPFFDDRPFADSAEAPWHPYRAPFGAWNSAGYREQAFGEGSQVQSMAEQYAGANGVPLSLVDRVIKRESGGNPRAVSRGNYGLMQIRLGSARAMGYRGSAAGLLDPAVNMTYAVRYLAGAYRAAGGNESRAVALYARGYNAAPRLQYASYDGERPEQAAFVGGAYYNSFTQPYAVHRVSHDRHRAM